MIKKKRFNKKVVLIANTSWYFYNFRKELIFEIKKKDYETYLICPKDEYSDKLRNSGFNLIYWDLNRRSINLIEEIKSIIKLRKIIKNIGPSLVHTFTIKGNFYGTIAVSLIREEKIIINSVTGLGSLFLTETYKFKILRFLLHPLMKFIFLKSSKIILQNKDDRKMLIDLGFTTLKNSIIIPSSGINTNFFKPKSFKRLNDYIIFFPSRLIKQKGFVELFKACKSLWQKGYEFKLYIAGDIDKGNQSSLTENEVCNLKKNKHIVFLGHVKNIKKYYSKSDLVVLPSWREGLSRSLLEAAAMAKPIITSDVPGCRDIITNKKNGLLVPIKDPEAIEESILFIYENQELAIKYGKNARKKVLKDFEVDKINKSTLEIYSSLISKKFLNS